MLGFIAPNVGIACIVVAATKFIPEIEQKRTGTVLKKEMDERQRTYNREWLVTHPDAYVIQEGTVEHPNMSISTRPVGR